TKSPASNHQSPSSQHASQYMASKDNTELPIVFAVPNQLVHGKSLEDDCVRVSVEKAILPNHSLPIPSHQLKTVFDAVNSFVAWPKTLVISFSTNQPLSYPDEHGSHPKTKKRKKKKPSDTKNGELKFQRSSKRLKTAA
ncbi:hypothetical protein MKX01_026220, partial [Papaver californicum]